MELKKKEDGNRNFRVECTLLGPYPKGRVVSEQELLEHKGVDIQRLLDLKSISETKDEPDTSELEPGPENVAPPPVPEKAQTEPTGHREVTSGPVPVARPVAKK